jgi:hypothetical protein
LVRIDPVRVSARGRIALGQSQDHQIIFFDSAGKRLGSYGRMGTGPGEFGASVRQVGWATRFGCSRDCHRRSYSFHPNTALQGRQ